MKTTIIILVAVLVAIAVNAQASTYVVKSGDTLGGIARKCNVTVSEITKVNKIRNINRIAAGQVLQIPEKATAKTTQVKKFATFAKASVTEKSEVKVVAKRTEAQENLENFEVKSSANSSLADSSEPWNEDIIEAEKEIQNKQAEANLKKAAKLGMTASASRQSIIPETGKPGESKDEVSYHKFFEFDATLGGWTTSKTKGVYSLVEGIQWFGNQDGDQNLGIGGVLQLDKGWGENSASWGFVAPGIELGYWKNLNDKMYVLVKPRISYRFNQHTPWNDKPNQGIMLGGYGEVTRIFTAKDLGIIAADGNYFQNDSYASVRVYWEHMVNKNWKVKAGVGPVGHFSKDESTFGISPALIAKYNDTISVGVTADTSKGGPFYGAFVTYEFNSDRHDPLNIKK
jgi:LysM repeat protein